MIRSGELKGESFALSSTFRTSGQCNRFSSSALAYGNEMRMVLTECEESKDDGVGDEVDGVAGAGEVELPASDALVH